MMKGGDIVLEAFFERDQSSDAPVPVLKGVNPLKLEVNFINESREK